jgi:hypothetical protein
MPRKQGKTGKHALAVCGVLVILIATVVKLIADDRKDI